SDARRIAGGDIYELDRMLAALGGAPLRLHLVEPGRGGLLVQEGAVDARQDGHGGILTRRCRGAGERLRERAGEVDDGGEASHSELLTTIERMEPLRSHVVPVVPKVAVGAHSTGRLYVKSRRNTPSRYIEIVEPLKRSSIT